ncbi:MAG TPA: hypothetical protein VGG45_16360 [Terracidiphilus sp.]|jgi:hypothetical protein
MTDKTDENPLNPVRDNIGDAPVAPAHGIASLALALALKYHDINTIQDGTLYQQYKLEGRNMRDLHLDMVFETAIAMERHLLASSQRIAAIVVEALEISVDEEVGPQSDGKLEDEEADQ